MSTQPRWLVFLIGVMVGAAVPMVSTAVKPSPPCDAGVDSGAPYPSYIPGGDGSRSFERGWDGGPAAGEACSARIEQLQAACDRARLDAELPSEATAYPRSEEQLREMAASCEVLSDHPAALSPEQEESMGLSAEESAAYAQALGEVMRRAQQRRNEVWHDVYGEAMPEPDGDHFDLNAFVASLNDQIQRLPGSDDHGLPERLARERAGFSSAPRDEDLSPYERFMRISHRIPEEFQHELARTVGAERAAELRAIFGGWPGDRLQMEGCSLDPSSRP